jgi:adhesin transport system outer membrane protein
LFRRSVHDPASALLLLAALALPASARAEGPVADFRTAITRAALENPEVMSAWHNFEASRDERKVAQGNYFPRLDIDAGSGKEKSRTPLRLEDRYRTENTRLNLTQMLFDGFATRNEVDRLDHVSRARYYELEESSEVVGLDATAAYLDVLRRQRLVRLAQDNLDQHESIFNDIQARVQAGVSRRVDLEQASARLALAETNLLIETANLHDVTARFQRVIGELPADDLAEPQLPLGLIPLEPRAALMKAYGRHPRLRGARASIQAARAELRTKAAPMLPRVDLRLSQQRAEDLEGIEGSHDQATAELVFSYNVFRGGSDVYRRRQFDNRLSAARELREKACRDVRQTLVIAYNDTRSFEAQLEYLERNELAIGKARVSYREQFQIGQRSLLDLLDSENEYFEIRRRKANTASDLQIAQARTLAAMGILLDGLEVRRRGADDEPSRVDDDELLGLTRCPPDIPRSLPLRRDAIPGRGRRDATLRD